MKQLSLSTGEWLFVVVPKDAKDFATHWSTHWTDDVQKLVFTSDIQDPLKCGGDMLHLPDGSWSIIGKAIELSDEECKMIAPKVAGGFFGHIPGYKRLEKIQWMDGEPHETAKESLNSLIQSLCLDHENVLILRKQ